MTKKTDDKYYKAYLREKKARREAEMLLETKTTSLYLAKEKLEVANAQLISHSRELIKTEKLASLGKMAAGIAHEIKNPLAYVNSNFRLLEDFLSAHKRRIYAVCEKSSEDPENAPYTDVHNPSEELADLMDMDLWKEVKEVIEDIEGGLKKIESISSSMMGFSHRRKDKEGLLDLNDVVRSAIKMLALKSIEREQLQFSYEELPPTHGVESHYSQIIVNLISNALHAIRGDHAGRVRVSTYLVEEGVAVQVEDNGVGMNEQTLDKIFDPFFTSKPVGEGTGLGLYLVYSLVQELDGTVDVTSELGRGTSIVVTFPMEGGKEE